MAMAQKYLFIAISFYRNIVRENVSCELGQRTIFFGKNGKPGLKFKKLLKENSKYISKC